MQWQSVEDELLLYAPISTCGKLTYNYKFGGKELQEELGFQSYDFGARNYDPALGRWINIDPLAETSRRWTTYNYAYNNPLRFIDPDGMVSSDTAQHDLSSHGNYMKAASDGGGGDLDQIGRSRHDENGGYLMPGERSGGDDGFSGGLINSRNKSSKGETESEKDGQEGSSQKPNPPSSFMKFLQHILGFIKTSQDENDEVTRDRDIFVGGIQESIKVGSAIQGAMLTVHCHLGVKGVRLWQDYKLYNAKGL